MSQTPRALQVEVTDEELRVDLDDGRTIICPLSWFPRLSAAQPEQRSQWRLIGSGQGIHWEALDEDLSVAGLLNPAPRRPAVRAQERA